MTELGRGWMIGTLILWTLEWFVDFDNHEYVPTLKPNPSAKLQPRLRP